MSNDLQGLLVRTELVTIEQLRLAEDAVRGTTSTWLEQLLMWRWVDEDAVARLAGNNAGVPPCDLDRLAHLPARVVAQLPRDLAVEHRVVPLAVEPDGDLCLGMVNPCDLVAVQEIEFFLGRRVLREVTPATPLAWALCSYYAASGPLWPPWDPETIVTRPARLARGSVPPPLVDRTER
jgi:hypothetical protein